MKMPAGIKTWLSIAAWNADRRDWPRRRSPLETFGLYLAQFKLTRQGKIVAASAFASGMLAMASLEIPVYQLFVGLCALFGATWAAGIAFRPRLDIAGAPPEKASAGQPVSAQFILTHRGRFPAFDLGLNYFALPDQVEAVGEETTLDSLVPGRPQPFTMTLIARRRGLYEMPRPRAYSTFPFGLWRTEARYDARSFSALRPHALLVTPHFHPAADIALPVLPRHQPGGVALTSHVGESPEYIGSREYRPGDSVRHLDYRSWARLAYPVVREYQEEYYCRVALVLDTFVAPGTREGPDGFLEFEAAVSLAATVAEALSRGEHIIDIFAAGPQLYVFRTGRHTVHFENVLEVLACIGASRENPFDTILPALVDELGNISTAVFVFLDWDDTRRTLVRRALEAGCEVKVFVVRDTPPALPLDENAPPARFSLFSSATIARGAFEVL